MIAILAGVEYLIDSGVVRFTGNKSVDEILVVVPVVGYFILLVTIHAARDGIVWFIKAVLFSGAGFMAREFIVSNAGGSHTETVCAGYIGMAIGFSLLPIRSRHMPAQRPILPTVTFKDYR